ncbi:MAG: PTS system mannose/fructose/sorbose family transporter subunit IID [Bacillota bacterium]|jgi:fructoselysine and glucoselysine-specific PTS system IID component|nr:PTS system mannose/fructose/sorbose family transporter subunit IID [Bacillota bacterium]NLL26433.1 PTS system mannose/fructose/sorbose family transporter subunit IID [Erysipelotrichia bacterium]
MSSKVKKITEKELKQVFLRSCTLDSGWNYERQQHINYCFTMIPVLKKLYSDDPEKMKRALHRHLEFMACTPHIVTLLAGITAAMEEENANNPDFDEQSISAVKTSLMGPMAGFGDSIFWGSLLTIAVGVGTSFASQGSIIGPILFFLTINVPGFLSRYYGLKIGYNSGTTFFANMEKSGMINKLSKAATILGLLVVGSMAASQISVSIPWVIEINGIVTPIQEYIDWIMPCFLPACTFVLMYWLLGKKIKTTTLLLWTFVTCLILSYFQIL